MKNFYTALMTYFNAAPGGVHNAFYTDIGGRLYHGDAPDRTTYPYCVIFHIVDTQMDTFKTKMDQVVIQFSIFSDKSSPIEVHDAMTHLKSLFDDCTLSISGGTLVYFFHISDGLMREEVTTVSAEQVIWHFHCDYNAIFERS